MKKSWGEVNNIYMSDAASVDVLNIKAGMSCSRHYHATKWNKFHLISGKMLVNFGATPQTTQELCPGHEITLLPLVEHSFTAIEDSVVIEISFARMDPDDIIRLG